MRFRTSKTMMVLLVIVIINIIYVYRSVDNLKSHASNVANAANVVWDRLKDSSFKTTDDDGVKNILNQPELDTTLAHDDAGEDLSVNGGKLQINSNNFTPEKWLNNPSLFYDLIFTLSIITHEINNNAKSLPFTWSDYVDLTKFNEDLLKPSDQRSKCRSLKSHHGNSRPGFCVDTEELTIDELELIGLPMDQIPGYTVLFAPDEGDYEMRVLHGKNYLLTFMPIPMNLIYMNIEQQYIEETDKYQEVERGFIIPIEGKSRLVDTDLILYLQGLTEIEIESIQVNASYSFGGVDHNKLDAHDFKYKSNFKKLQERLDKLDNLITNEIKFNMEKIDKLKLSRQEFKSYQSQKYSKLFDQESELPYFFTYLDNDQSRQVYLDWRFVPERPNNYHPIETDRINKKNLIKGWNKFSNIMQLNSWIEMKNWHLSSTGNLTTYTPVKELMRLCHYNQSIIINENINKYYLDCSVYLSRREASEEGNIIDARFIDIDSGRFIEIVGVTALPNAGADAGKNSWNYKDRSGREFKLDDMLPLKSRVINGLKFNVAANHEDIEVQNYGFIDLDSLNGIMNEKIEEMDDFNGIVSDEVLTKLHNLDN